MSKPVLTAEAVRLMEETLPVATYSCAQCPTEERGSQVGLPRRALGM